jgi:hypothetical protein
MKTRDIAIIAAVGVAAYLLTRKKKEEPARGYTLTIPAPDILSRQEYERQLASQRRLDAIKNLATTAGEFINKIFGKQKIATVEKKSLSAGINPVVGPKKIGLIY